MKVYGLDRCIERLDTRILRIKGKSQKILTRLAEIGIDVATARFATAQYDGINDVVVSQEPQWLDETRLMISAEGNTVAFIEFGTGVHYKESHPKANELGAVRGSYGYGLGKFDSWMYEGSPGTDGEVVGERNGVDVVETHGNPPARAMYDAAQQMRAKMLEIAKEVWSND